MGFGLSQMLQTIKNIMHTVLFQYYIGARAMWKSSLIKQANKLVVSITNCCQVITA